MSLPALSQGVSLPPSPPARPTRASSQLSPSLLQTQQKKVLVVSVAEITFNRLVYSQLPGQETFLRAQVVTMWQAVAGLVRQFLMLNP